MTRFNIVAVAVVGDTGATSRTKVLAQAIATALTAALADVTPTRLQTLAISRRPT